MCRADGIVVDLGRDPILFLHGSHFILPTFSSITFVITYLHTRGNLQRPNNLSTHISLGCGRIRSNQKKEQHANFTQTALEVGVEPVFLVLNSSSCVTFSLVSGRIVDTDKNRNEAGNWTRYKNELHTEW